MSSYFLRIIFLIIFVFNPGYGQIDRKTVQFPDFTLDFWQEQQKLAEGKIRRGQGLAILGLLSFIPEGFLVKKAMAKIKGE